MNIPKSPASNQVHQSVPKRLISKGEVAKAVGVSFKTIERWTSRRMIPFLRLSSRLTKYDLERVISALRKYEITEVGRSPSIQTSIHQPAIHLHRTRQPFA